MSEHDRALLEAFCEWIDSCEHLWLATDTSRADFIDAFLAARAQPEARAVIIQCPACGEGFVRPGDEGKRLPNVPCPHGRPPGECAECDGGSSPEAQRADLAAEIREDMAAETAPPVGRFWRVWDVLNYHGIAECNRAGVPSLLLDLRIVTTREEAMKMGADCGLPSWYDALPERFWRVVSCESYGFIGYRALAWSQSNTTINTNDCGPWHWAAADVPSNEFRVQAREAAEEDGRASGLNPWKGGK